MEQHGQQQPSAMSHPNAEHVLALSQLGGLGVCTSASPVVRRGIV